MLRLVKAPGEVKSHEYLVADRCVRLTRNFADFTNFFSPAAGGGSVAAVTRTNRIEHDGQQMQKSPDERLRLETWPITRLIPSPRNARTHSDAQVAEIAGSIRAFGFSNPILVGEDGDIVAGHGRLAAARLLGLTEVPVIVLSGLSEVQRRQLMLADNRIALNAGWDLEMLQLELKDLARSVPTLQRLGFTAEELAKALTRAAPPA